MELASILFDLTQAGAILADMVAAYLDAAPPPVAEETPRARMRAPSSRASPSIMSAPGEIQGAGLRANQGNDEMAFRQGVADDQPSGSALRSQNKNLHVRSRSSLV